MGNPHQLTAGPGTTGTVRRSVLYAAGTASVLVLTVTASLALWVLLPWALLGWSPTLVTSGSMEPLVSTGDVVMVHPVHGAEVGRGTVVLYDRPETGRILHRVVAQLPDGSFRTQGDANDSPDSLAVRPGDIRGAAVLAVPWIGRPSLWLSQRRLLPLVTAATALVVALGLAPRAFDPAFDPWAAGSRISPAQVLIGAAAGTRAPDQPAALLPVHLLDVVHERLAHQGRLLHRRTADLLEGLS